MQKKYIILIEFITIVGGVFLTALNYLETRTSPIEIAISFGLLAFGIMFRLWRKEFFTAP
ncbi:hypothetical protein SAMN05216474_1829 [Lishizhenia tianjinensis]|uniref:Uncharacterized protein n=1 Tax=Lishizhenia tianjinensis TaxID=477690 RepID=A0A1I7A266_9FLAO|nr:hypothetical protein [Lishizhenia tianjinensis]SFT68982.1 hypothetical protein SAMN05216474_1829 [Lishizhenia tianjinensis]